VQYYVYNTDYVDTSAFESSLLAQVSSLGGTINKYGRVTAIGLELIYNNSD